MVGTMNIYAERLKERVEWAKKNRGLTQEQIANAANLTRTALRHYWDRGGTPNERSLLLLADILECDLNWLIGRDTTPEWPKTDPLEDIRSKLGSIDKKLEG